MKNQQKEAPQAAPKISADSLRAALQTMQEYKAGKANLERRIVENEQWYKMLHWAQLRGGKKGELEPSSAWLFNSIANKHADALDAFPQPNVLPREESDKTDAKLLSAVLPVILERSGFEQTYSDCWWYKLKTGTGVYGVFWNTSLEGGLGDIDVKKLDILNLFWEPGISDIQKSRNLFSVELVDRDVLESRYPALSGTLKGGESGIDLAKYLYDDTVDTTKKAIVVDWYYKLSDEAGATKLHYCKFVEETVLFSSENDARYAQRGFYDHGQYPLVFDTLFLEEGTPAGFGYIDVMRDAQGYIDLLGSAILKNTLVGTKPRFFIRDTGSVAEEEFADLSKDFVHVAGTQLGENDLRQIQVQPVSSSALNVFQMKIDELKETSGNRDFSQGSTASGVTAASAIAALQEAGSKLSRDMNKSGYRAFRQICYLCIELIRQFYEEPRSFRIAGQGGAEEYASFDNRTLRPQPQENVFGVDTGYRRPIFDVVVTSQKSSPFNQMAQNELAKELFSMGFFNPQLADQALCAVKLMDFEGKDMVEQKIAQNGTLLQAVEQMQVQMQKMAAIIDAQNGTTLLPGMTGEPAGAAGQSPAKGADSAGLLDSQTGARVSSTAGKARVRAAQAATPQ